MRCISERESRNCLRNPPNTQYLERENVWRRPKWQSVSHKFNHQIYGTPPLTTVQRCSLTNEPYFQTMLRAMPIGHGHATWRDVDYPEVRRCKSRCCRIVPYMKEQKNLGAHHGNSESDYGEKRETEKCTKIFHSYYRPTCRHKNMDNSKTRNEEGEEKRGRARPTRR